MLPVKMKDLFFLRLPTSYPLFDIMGKYQLNLAITEGKISFAEKVFDILQTSPFLLKFL